MRGCAGLDTLPRARVLVGGLGMGFTARAALAAHGGKIWAESSAGGARFTFILPVAR